MKLRGSRFSFQVFALVPLIYSSWSIPQPTNCVGQAVLLQVGMSQSRWMRSLIAHTLVDLGIVYLCLRTSCKNFGEFLQFIRKPFHIEPFLAISTNHDSVPVSVFIGKVLYIYILATTMSALHFITSNPGHKYCPTLYPRFQATKKPQH